MPVPGLACPVQLLKRMRPVIVAFTETEEGASSSDVFVRRFEASMSHHWDAFQAHDAALGGRDARLLVPWERVFNRSNVCTVVACEGAQRVIRPMSHADWWAWFTQWGFKALPIGPQVFLDLQKLLSCFSPEFGTSLVGSTAWLTWKGRALAHSSCWVLKQEGC